MVPVLGLTDSVAGPAKRRHAPTSAGPVRRPCCRIRTSRQTSRTIWVFTGRCSGGASSHQRVVGDDVDDARNPPAHVMNQCHGFKGEHLLGIATRGSNPAEEIHRGFAERQRPQLAPHRDPLLQLAHRSDRRAVSPARAARRGSRTRSFSSLVSMFARSRISSSRLDGRLWASSTIITVVSFAAWR